MQVRHYVDILRRFWVMIVVLPLVVAGGSFALQRKQPPRYTSVGRVMVTQTPHNKDEVLPFPDLNLIHSWQSSEYILDDVPQVLSSMALAEDVSAWLKSQGHDVTPAVIRAGLAGEKFHRSITITSNVDNPELAQKFVEGAIESLQTHGLKYWNRHTDTDTGLRVAVLDPPSDAMQVSNRRTLVLDVGLSGILAFATAVGLAFLFHYLDDTLRDPHQVETYLGLHVLGTIPRKGKF